MLKRRPVTSAIVLVVLSTVLQSCASTSHQATVSETRVDELDSVKAPELNNLSTGDLVELYDGVLAPFGRITIGREYFAASGRLCKEILNASGKELVSIACRVSEDEWYTREPLNLSSSPRATSSSLLVPTIPEGSAATSKNGFSVDGRTDTLAVLYEQTHSDNAIPSAS